MLAARLGRAKERDDMVPPSSCLFDGDPKASMLFRGRRDSILEHSSKAGESIPTRTGDGLTAASNGDRTGESARPGD